MSNLLRAELVQGEEAVPRKLQPEGFSKAQRRSSDPEGTVSFLSFLFLLFLSPPFSFLSLFLLLL